MDFWQEDLCFAQLCGGGVLRYPVPTWLLFLNNCEDQGCTSRPGTGINNKIWAVPEGQPKAGPGLPEIAGATDPAIPGDPIKFCMQLRVVCSGFWEWQ